MGPRKSRPVRSPGRRSGQFPSEEPTTSIRDFSHLDASVQREPAVPRRPHARAHSRIDRSSVPVLAVDPAALRNFAVDHRAGFLLSRIDGQTPIDGLLDLAAMPEEEALQLLRELLDQGILVLR